MDTVRQIILDTETTGLVPEEGHRIIEIGCVELLDRRLTKHRFQVYLNPEREVEQGALEVHGIDNAFLANKPLFRDIVDDFIKFISGAEVIIHNAPFDVGFINHELSLIGNSHRTMDEFCEITDTLVMARKKHPGQRNSLDALCKRYNIDNSHRELHGALLDAEILAEVYLIMTGGQISLSWDEEDHDNLSDPAMVKKLNYHSRLKVIRCTEQELAAHEKRLREIDKESGGKCVWAK